MSTDNLKSGKVSKFILRLYEMINSSKNISTITWVDSGSSFAILNTSSFTSELLKKHFKHKNYSSFVRQLNLYGFNKERDTGELQVYSNPNFLKNHGERLILIRRRVPAIKSINLSTNLDKTKMQTVLAQQVQIKKNFAELEQKYKNISDSNELLAKKLENCIEREEKVEQLLGNFIRIVKESQTNMEGQFYNMFMGAISGNINQSTVNGLGMFRSN